jgi:molecular chaperone DnaK
MSGTQATLGIDLGTCNAVAAVLEEGRARVVRNQQGATTTPLVVSRSVVGEWYAGQTAKRLAIMHPRETAWDFVRLLAKRFDSPEVRNAAGLSPFAVVEGPRGDACLRMGGETVHPAALVAIVLAKLKASAEAESGRPVRDAVFAAPANFHSGQRRLLETAGRLAGLELHRIHAAPSVAALCPGVPRGVVALCDLGGGSFGVSVVAVEDGIVQVLAQDWESFLGGEDFDLVIVRWLVDALRREEGIDASMDPVVLAHMKEAAEKAKRRLSVANEVEVSVPLGGTGLFAATLSRHEVEAMLEPQLEWLRAPCTRALQAAGLTKADLAAVLTLGGSTRIPRVLQTIGEIFEKEPIAALHPEEAPALGAAIRAGMLTGEVPGVFLDVQSRDLGIEYPRGCFAPVIERNTNLPSKKARVFLTRESRIDIHALEGASTLASECVSLGRIVWELPFRRKESEIEVEFEVDASGRVDVTVTEPSSGIRHRITPRHGSDLAAEETERYRSEIERYQARLLAERVSQVTAPARLEALGTAEKVMAALNGDRTTRLELVRDPDRAVWSAVLESPRTTSEDVASVCALPEISPDVLREIAASPEWSKKYDIVLALVTHPLSPPEVALRLVDRLRTPDLESILADDSFSTALRAQCRALMKMRF